MRPMTFCKAVCLTLSLCSFALAQGTAKELIAKLPEKDVAAAKDVMAAVVRLGPDAVREIAASVRPAGTRDADARFALNGLAHHVSRPGAEAERVMYAGAIIESLEAERPAEVRAFLISMLQRAGRDESVPVLAKFLTDKDLGDPAARALTSIRSKAAGDALTAALPNADEANRASILRALGDIRHAPAARQILGHAIDGDGVTRGMALYALANIGAPEAAEILARALANEPSRQEQSQAVSLYLLLAERLAEAGQKERSVQICRDLIEGRAGVAGPHVVCGALATLVKVNGHEAMADLLKALDGESKAIRMAALELMIPMPDDRVTAALVAKLGQADGERRAEIVGALGRSQDAQAWTAVVARLKDEEKLVRLAAVEAVGRKADDAALAALLQAVNDAAAEEARAISEALQRIPGDAAMAAVAMELPKVQPPARVALLETLAARRARGQVEPVLAATHDEDSAVRTAAIKALRDVGSADTLPRMLDLLLGTEDEKVQAEWVQAVVAVAQRTPEAEKRAEPVLAALSRADGGGRRVLLKSLPQLGGAAALDELVKATQVKDRGTKDVAARALAEWKDPAAAPHLLTIAQESDNNTHRVLALRGYLRLAGLPDKRPAGERIEMYRKALAAAQRPDEKRLALSGLSGVRHVDALNLVAEYAADAELGAEAALAALKIVTPQNKSQQPLSGLEVSQALERIAASVKDEGTREKILAHVKESPAQD